jgi:hypothetical protein
MGAVMMVYYNGFRTRKEGIREKLMVQAYLAFIGFYPTIILFLNPL